jgi:hypothetical protein
VSDRVFEPLVFVCWVDHKVSKTGSHVRFDHKRVFDRVIEEIESDVVLKCWLTRQTRPSLLRLRAPFLSHERTRLKLAKLFFLFSFLFFFLGNVILQWCYSLWKNTLKHPHLSLCLAIFPSFLEHHQQDLMSYLFAGKYFFKVNFRKVNFKKVNYFLMFDSVIKNKLKNIFQCLVISWKMSWKITY